MRPAMTQQRTTRISDLPAYDEESKCLNAIVEAVRGSRNKFKFDEQHQLFVHDAALPTGQSWPFDFGFVPSTRGEDGDPIDVLVLMDEPAFVGAVVPCRLIGAIEAMQLEKDGQKVRNDRLIAVARKTHAYADIRDIDDLPDAVVDQVEAFWVSLNEQRGREFEILKRVGPRGAWPIVYKYAQ
jgi:inorganic pyrophosphatase